MDLVDEHEEEEMLGAINWGRGESGHGEGAAAGSAAVTSSGGGAQAGFTRPCDSVDSTSTEYKRCLQYNDEQEHPIAFAQSLIKMLQNTNNKQLCFTNAKKDSLRTSDQHATKAVGRILSVRFLAAYPAFRESIGLELDSVVLAIDSDGEDPDGQPPDPMVRTRPTDADNCAVDTATWMRADIIPQVLALVKLAGYNTALSAAVLAPATSAYGYVMQHVSSDGPGTTVDIVSAAEAVIAGGLFPPLGRRKATNGEALARWVHGLLDPSMAAAMAVHTMGASRPEVDEGVQKIKLFDPVGLAMQLFFSAHEFTDPLGIDSDPALSTSASRLNVNLDVSDFTPAKIQLLYNALRSNFGPLVLKWIVSGNNQPNFGVFCDDKSTIYIFYLCKSRSGMGANGAPKVVPDWLTRTMTTG